MTYVYFIQAGVDGPVKIGLSVHPERRLRVLQGSSSERLTLLGFVSGGADEERRWHDGWSDLRLHGEWFRPSEELLRAIFEEVEAGACLVGV